MGRDGEDAGQPKLGADPQESRVSGPAGLSKPEMGSVLIGALFKVALG